MKKLVCGMNGEIYYGNVLKNGTVSPKNRINMTDEAVNAVGQHMVLYNNKYMEEGVFGYKIRLENRDEDALLLLFDEDKFKIVPIHEESEVSLP
jgi:hypothetical protein